MRCNAGKNSQRTSEPRKRMPKRLPGIGLLLVIFVLAGGLTFAVEMYFDWLWYAEIGKAEVFTTTLYAKSALGSVTLLFSFLFIYLNLWFANRGPGSIRIGIPTPTGEITAYTFPQETVRKTAGAIALLLSAFLALRAAAHWETVWKWLHAAEFGVRDPVFSRDISFYFFHLPFLEELVRLGLALCFLSAAGSLALYHFKGILSLGKMQSFGRRSPARAHISILAALGFLVLALDAYLDRFQVLFSTAGPMFGATY